MKTSKFKNCLPFLLQHKYYVVMYTTLSLSLSLLFGCYSQKNNESFIELSNGETLDIELGLPISASLYDNYLFITDFYGESGLIKIVDIQKEKIVNSFANKGEGPNDFLSIANVDYAPIIDRKFYVFDQVANKIKVFDFDSLVFHKQKEPQTVLSLNGDLRFYEIMKTYNGYVATGIIENKKFALLNDSLQVESWSGSYCPKPSNNIPDITHAVANYGKFFVSDNRKYLVNIIYAAGIITCYDIDKNGNLSLKWENTLSKMDYKLKGDSFLNIGVMGYLSISFTDKYIYALYSGKKEDNNAIATYGQEIHVYDYNGKIIKRYMINNQALGICVTKNDGYIYTIVHNPESGIIKYAL